MWRRMGQKALDVFTTAGGFTLSVASVAFAVHLRAAGPLVSFRYWNGKAGLPGLLADLAGPAGLRSAILALPTPACGLSPWQAQLLKTAFRYPEAYQRFLQVYLVTALIAFLVGARFLYFLAVRPLSGLRRRLVKPLMVRTPRWDPGQSGLELVVGMRHLPASTALVEAPVPVKIGMNSLRTGMIVTGTTGTGKTYGALYTYTRQFLYYRPRDVRLKPAFLILDVKGNYCDQVMTFIGEVGRMQDAIVIELGGMYRYNPLNKPLLRPQVLANRLRVILETFSAGKTQDTYWLDKAETMIAEAIKLARLACDGYVTFKTIDSLIRKKEYRSCIEAVRRRSEAGLLLPEEEETRQSVEDFFLCEFEQCDERVRSIIESEVTRMTGAFTSDPLVTRTFCASREELNFAGFDDMVDSGKIVMLRMNAEEYQNLAKIMSTYLKLDFQSAVLTRLVRPNANRERPLIFINDEYHFMASRTDGRFFSVCREANCVNVVATQSFTSLIESLGDKTVVEAILQNLVNKIWLRSDDHYTIEMAQHATGKSIQYRRSESLTECGKDSNYSWVFGRSVARNSNLSKAVSYQPVEDFVYPYDLFRQGLKILTGVAFLYTGSSIDSLDRDIDVTVVHLVPFDRLPLVPPACATSDPLIPAGGFSRRERASGTNEPKWPEGEGLRQRTPDRTIEPGESGNNEPGGHPSEPERGTAVSSVVFTRVKNEMPEPPPRKPRAPTTGTGEDERRRLLETEDESGL